MFNKFRDNIKSDDKDSISFFTQISKDLDSFEKMALESRNMLKSGNIVSISELVGKYFGSVEYFNTVQNNFSNLKYLGFADIKDTQNAKLKLIADKVAQQTKSLAALIEQNLEIIDINTEVNNRMIEICRKHQDDVIRSNATYTHKAQSSADQAKFGACRNSASVVNRL